jgi:trehalose/maltose transport system permease protein
MAKKKTSALQREEQRLAYVLLIPTFVILFVIAIYPLFSVFYNSMTDRGFASGQEVNFVGFDNFRQLLSMKVKELSPVIDPETGGQMVDPETQELIYERPIDVLPKEPYRFQQMSQFDLFGNRYVLGASDPEFVRSIGDTLQFTIITVVLETILGLGVAMALNSKFPGRGMMRAIMLVPWAIPTAVSSRMWQWMLGSTRTGFFNVVFQKLNLGNGQIPFLVSDQWQLPAMIAIDVWKTTPFMALLLLAGLQLIPKDLYEAADVDGASKIRQFFSVTLPLLRPTIAVALVFRTLDAIRVFDLFQIVLRRQRYSMASFAYYKLITEQEMGYSSAASVVIFLVITIFAILYIRYLGVDTES